MSRALDAVRSMLPALAFLCVGVPLAALLDRLGFFEATAIAVQRRWAALPVAALWVLAAVTTAVLNLDTTVVLLTPLYLRLARQADVDPLPLAVIPLVLASLASSVLPVSNLTTLIAAERTGFSVGDVLVHLGPVSVAASAVGWVAYRRRWPTRLPAAAVAAPDRRALRIGGAVVAGVLVGFVAGPAWGVAPWMVALAADVVLAGITRWAPWREVPVATAIGVAVVAGLVAVALPVAWFRSVGDGGAPLATVVVVAAGAAVANAVNNLPAVLVAFDGGGAMSWTSWAWLAGVNTGAALLPLGALANILWWRIVRDEGVALTWRRYAGLTFPLVLPALLAGAVVLAAEHWVLGA